MASSTVSTKIACLILVTMLVIAPHHSAQAAIECPAVLKMVGPCLDYLKKGGDIPTECCTGVKSLDSITKTQPERQEACECIKPMADSNSINYDLANKLAPACGVDIQINITPNMDCSTYVLLY